MMPKIKTVRGIENREVGSSPEFGIPYIFDGIIRPYEIAFPWFPRAITS